MLLCTKYYSNRLHNSGDIKVRHFAETLKYTHTVTSFYPVIVYEMTLTLTFNFDIRHKISDSYQLSTQGQPKFPKANLIEPVLGIYICNDFCTCLNAE